MKYTILLLVIGIFLIIIPINISQPDFNGSNPGCDGSGCHTLEDGLVSVEATGLDVAITVNTTSTVAGELVDASGTVVAVNNSTGNNPFTLTAPGPGVYTVNAGFKNPNPRRWDSVVVNISLTNIGEYPSNPTVFKLYDNYPNPFNPSTTIRYSIPEASFTTLIVYDALGNEVSSLVNETKSAGTFEVIFDAKNLSSGIYYYTLQSGSITETKKMILTK
ncbi:MAG: T9SS type A sorting domain-containing protein [Ignavibacteria bacterium]|nr:T9SS type A sorting domain-containing protein [Ignavibacteria bacterium]